MWISSMTVGGNMKLPPSRLVLRFSFFLVDGAAAGAFFSFAMILCLCLCRIVAAVLRQIRKSEDELLFGRLEIVVVPELTAGDDLLHLLDAVGRLEAVHLQLAGEPGLVEVRHL